MDCREARKLLDQGGAANLPPNQAAALNEHLAACSECRSYRDGQLLNALLAGSATAAKPAGMSPAPVSDDDGPPPQRPLRAWLLPFAGGALLGVALIAMYMLGQTASAMFAIQQNVAAMRPATAVLVGTPPTREPTVAIPAAAQATIAAHATVIAVQHTAAPATSIPLQPTATTAPTASNADAPTATPALQAVPTASITPVPLGDGGVTATPILMPIGTLTGDQIRTQAPPSGGAITVLLLGIDRRPDETGPARADSIMIARIEPERQRVALLSLPRDLIVNIPGYGNARINAASVYGEIYPELGGGVELSRRTVSELLGIPIDYVVHVDFMGFINAIDSIGGIDVDVEKEIYDPSYPTMDYGWQEIHFLPGPQHMDGNTALIYGRTRHADSDWDRARRQQAIMVGIANRLREQNTLEQVQSVAKLTESLRGFIQTDMPQDRMLGLAWAFRNLDPNLVERYSLDGSMVGTGYSAEDPYAQYALPGTIEALVQHLMNGP